MSKFGFSLLSLILGAGLGLYLADTWQWSEQGLEYRPVQYFADGAEYAGPLNDSGRAEGEGRMQWPNGDRYEGDFQAGMMHGEGTYTAANGYSYRGEFVRGRGHGLAEIHYADDSVYRGQVRDDARHGQGVMTFPDGDSYRGEFHRDLIQGVGTWRVEDSHTYRGQLQNGQYHGDGDIRFDSGEHYTGQFRRGEYHGRGVFTTADGTRYDGEFIEGRFTGRGTATFPDGRRHVGEFVDWVASGDGVQTDAAGNQYRGTFKNGYLEGEGEYIGSDGEHYRGEFRYGRYSGQGQLWTAEGHHYEGAFQYGRMHGQGHWSAAGDSGAEYSGRWENGELVAAGEGMMIFAPEAIAEHALYQQESMLEARLAKLRAGNPSSIDLFTLAVGAFGSEEVFRREINYIEQDFTRRFDNADHAVYLSNSRRSLDDRPLATLTSLERSLQHLGRKMDRDQDILFLYLTSHGMRDRTIAFEQPGLALPDLSAQRLRELLDASGIQWRVVVLSACYSGGFIDALRDDRTLLITAAAADKQSFGCSDSSDFTYFGEAFFKEALPRSESFVDAFASAVTLIRQWEQREDREPSLPQLVSGESIRQQLERWRSQHTRGSPQG